MRTKMITQYDITQLTHHFGSVGILLCCDTMHNKITSKLHDDCE